MKLIIAIIRENQLDQVRIALVEAGISRITVNNVSGHGRQLQQEEIYRGQRVVPNLVPNIRLEIAVNDDFVKPTVDTILKASTPNESGMIGSGKIFVLPLEEVVRLRTGETGPDAI